MINAEKYKDKLIELRSNGFPIVIVNGEPIGCRMTTDCFECRFRTKCDVGLLDWMLEESEE